MVRKKVEKHSAYVQSVISNTATKPRTIFIHKGDTIYDYLFSIKSPRDRISLYEKYGGRAIFGLESDRIQERVISKRAKAEARTNPLSNMYTKGVNVKVTKEDSFQKQGPPEKVKESSLVSGDSFQDAAVVNAMQEAKFTDANDAALYYEALARHDRRRKRENLHKFRDVVKKRVEVVKKDEQKEKNLEERKKREHAEYLKKKMDSYGRQVNRQNLDKMQEVRDREANREAFLLSQAAEEIPVKSLIPDLNLEKLDRVYPDPDLQTPHTIVPSPSIFDGNGQPRNGSFYLARKSPTIHRIPISPAVSSSSGGSAKQESSSRPSNKTRFGEMITVSEEDVVPLDQQNAIIHECTDAARRALLRHTAENKNRPEAPQFPDHVYKKEIDRVGNIIVIETPVFSITLDSPNEAKSTPVTRPDNIILQDHVTSTTKNNELESARNKEIMKQRYLEQRRYLEALREQYIQKIREQKLKIPPLCNCGVTDPFEDHAAKCCNNCPFYKNPEAYARQLASLLMALT